jgi:hypothetical protein
LVSVCRLVHVVKFLPGACSRGSCHLCHTSVYLSYSYVLLRGWVLTCLSF